MSTQELRQTQNSCQNVVITQLLLSLLFSHVLATLLGSILVVQILAHVPLTDLNLPANLLQTFQIIISFVSFDYFPPFEYVDADFTEVWYWSIVF